MRVLITGGAGFIGSHAVDHFVSMGDQVTVVDSLSYAGDTANLRDVPGTFDFTVADIGDARAMDILFMTKKFDAVVNFAAETHVDNSIADARPFIKANLEGATSLMEVSHRHNALFCQLSTDEVYGDNFGLGGRSTIHDPLLPRNPYSATKAAADMMLMARHNTYKQPYLIFRPSNNFGPRQHKEKFLPKLIDCLLRGVDFPLYGDGSQEREWTFAPDTVRLIREGIVSKNVKAWTSQGWGATFNISSGHNRTNAQMINATKAMLASKGFDVPDVVKSVEDRPGHDRRYRIESSFETDRFTRFEVALSETIDHYVRKQNVRSR